ncbi:hypothetical protein FRC12_007220 [Ceratobasidium sp. 428]|nr:hypothetical protein FRC12_007220 [Ceratobasidium sp. 428]
MSSTPILRENIGPVRVPIPQPKTTALETTPGPNHNPGDTDGHRTPSVRQLLTSYPDNFPIWTSTFEDAAETGWAAAWKQAFAAGDAEATRSKQASEDHLNELLRASSTTKDQTPPHKKTPKVAMPGLSATKRHITNFVKLPQEKRSSLAVVPESSTADAEALSKEEVAVASTLVKISPHGQQSNVQQPSKAENSQTTGPNRKREWPEGVLTTIRKLLLINPQSRKESILWEVQMAAKFQFRREQDRVRQNALSTAKEFMETQKRSISLNMDYQVTQAWEALDVVNNPERNLKNRAEQEWSLEATRLFTAGVLAVLSKHERGLASTTWKQAFEKTWELAWRDSWKAAWQATWEHGWDEAVLKGIELGMDEALKDREGTESKLLHKWHSYKTLKESLIKKEANYSDTLSKMHSMCKELNQLHHHAEGPRIPGDYKCL